MTKINQQTTVLPWGTYSAGDHTIPTDIEIGRTYKISLGTNGRYVLYFTPGAFGVSEQIALATTDGNTLISFKDKNTMNVNGSVDVRMIKRLDGLVL